MTGKGQILFLLCSGTKIFFKKILTEKTNGKIELSYSNVGIPNYNKCAVLISNDFQLSKTIVFVTLKLMLLISNILV